MTLTLTGAFEPPPKGGLCNTLYKGKHIEKLGFCHNQVGGGLLAYNIK
jgi:hypothetical protein